MQVASGTAACHLHRDGMALDSLEIALKGDRMGSEDFFVSLVHGGNAAGKSHPLEDQSILMPDALTTSAYFFRSVSICRLKSSDVLPTAVMPSRASRSSIAGSRTTALSSR